MFAKGPTPGATPKADFLKTWPGATCARTHYENGMSAYVVSLADGTFVAGRGTSAQAWVEAYAVMQRRAARSADAVATGKPQKG